MDTKISALPSVEAVDLAGSDVLPVVNQGTTKKVPLSQLASYIGGGGGVSVDALTDVNSPTPSDGDVLQYDSASGQWINVPPAFGGGATIGDPVSGGTANRILFNDNSGNLGDSADLVYQPLSTFLQHRGRAWFIAKAATDTPVLLIPHLAQTAKTFAQINPATSITNFELDKDGNIVVGSWQGSIINPAYLGSGSPAADKYLDGSGAWLPVRTKVSTVAEVGMQFSSSYDTSLIGNTGFDGGAYSFDAAGALGASLIDGYLARFANAGVAKFSIDPQGVVKQGYWRGSVIEPAYLDLPAINVKNYGAIGDGSSHPLSGVYGTLAAAQAVYPFVTSLTQELDWAACKAASNAALGADGSENADTNARLNRPIYIPAGSYMFGSDKWTIRNASGIKITGAGKRATRLYANGTVMAFDGLWYSEMSDMSIICQSGAATVAFDIDGNVPGHPYATRGVQGNVFRNMLFDGGWGDYVVAMTRLGSSGGQGSENIFQNCHFENADLACYYQNGFNALNNTFFGGNFQSYNKDAIKLEAGHVNVYSVGFQSTVGYTQIVNDGYDINAQGGGVSDKISIAGCRTESLRFLKSSGSTPVDVRTVTHNPAVFDWAATTAYALNTVQIHTCADGQKRLFRVTTAGNSGGAEPSWPNSGTVADGTVVWTQTDYYYLDVASGSVDIPSCVSPVNGPIRITTNFNIKETAANYTVQPQVTEVLVDASAGPITITIPAENDEKYSWPGRRLLVKKYDTSNNAVTIVDASGAYVDLNPAGVTIPGGTRGWVELINLGGGALTRRWFIIARSAYDGSSIQTGTIAAARLGAAGSDTQLQYNSAGAMAGDAKLAWDATNGRVLLGGAFITSLTGLNTTRRLVVGNDVSGYGRGVFVGKPTVDTNPGGGSIEFGYAISGNAYNRLYTVSGEVSNGSTVSSRKFIITDNQTAASVLEINQTGAITLGTWNGSIIGSAYGGTGNGFTKFTGPTTAEKTFTLPDSSQTLLHDATAAGGDLAGTYPNPTVKASVSLTTPVIGVATGTSLAVTGLLKSSGTAGVGYATGAGGTVTQTANKSNGVTLNKISGQVTMNGAALAAAAKVTFTVTNSTVAATDIPVVCVVSGGTANAYRASVAAVAAGSFAITVENITAGSLSESPVIGFAIIKAVNA